MVVVFLVQSCLGSIRCWLYVGGKNCWLQVNDIAGTLNIKLNITGLLHVVVGSMLKYVKYVEVC